MRTLKSLLLILSLFAAGSIAITLKAKTKTKTKAMATDSTLLSTDDTIQDCYDSMGSIYSSSNLTANSTDAFVQFVTNWCTETTLDVPNAVKASACFYSGFFLLRYMYPKASNSEDLTTLTYDFCNNYQTALPLRTYFVAQLMAVASTDSFNQTCLDLLSDTANINEWFSPIDPLASISENEICDIHDKLFTALAARGISSLAEHVSFSYLITLDLYFTASQQEDYENCINGYAYNETETFCSGLMSNQAQFVLWDSDTQSTVAATAASTVSSSCDSLKSCDACAISLAVIYQTYQISVNDLFSYIFQEYEKQIFYSLDAENKAYATDSTTTTTASTTSLVQLRMTNKSQVKK